MELSTLPRNAIYTAIIGDVLRSRASSERANLQEQFKKALQLVNERYGDDLVAPFDLIRGDECEALFIQPSAAYRAAIDIQQEILPARICFGIAMGTLDTPLPKAKKETPDVGQLDGPAFHLAREAVEASHKSSHERSFVPIQFTGLPASGLFLNPCMLAIGLLYDRMTDRQREVFETYRRLGTMEKVQDALSISKSSVHKALEAVDYETVLEIENRIAELLTSLGD
jgi:hypothetical protein